MVKLILSFFCLCLVATHHSFAYEVMTERYSLALLDKEGNPVLDAAGCLIEQESLYTIPVQINPLTTAIIVMDPWIDHPIKRVQDETSNVMQQWLIPLIYKAQAMGHIICIMTNDPQAAGDWTTKISPDLQALVDNKSVFLFYHQHYTTSTFSQWLRDHQIERLIYTGFASNICVWGRPTGIVHMYYEGFQLFFVPEASCAVETLDTWREQTIHQAYSRTFSMGLGGIIHWNDLMEAMQLSN